LNRGLNENIKKVEDQLSKCKRPCSSEKISVEVSPNTNNEESQTQEPALVVNESEQSEDQTAEDKKFVFNWYRHVDLSKPKL